MRRLDVAFSPAPGELLGTLSAALLLPLLGGLAVNWGAYGEGVLESLRLEA